MDKKRETKNKNQANTRLYAPTHQNAAKRSIDPWRAQRIRMEDPNVFAPTHGSHRTADKQPVNRNPRQAAVRADKRRHPSGKKSTKRSHRVLIWALACIALAGLIVGGYFLMLVEDIVVTGNQRFSADTIIQQSGLEAGNNLLLYALQAAEDKLCENPYIQEVNIKRVFPRTLSIEVTEREECAVVSSVGYHIVIDESGYVLKINDSIHDEQLLRINGVSLTGFQVNDTLAKSKDYQIKTLLEYLKALKSFALKDQIKTLDVANPLSVYMVTENDIQILFGLPDDITSKLEWVNEVLPTLTQNGVTGGTLDVSSDTGAVYTP